MDWVDVLYNECYGGFDYSRALEKRLADMRRGTEGLPASEAEALLRARYPVIGTDAQWKVAHHKRIVCEGRMHPFNLHLVREMNEAANVHYSQLAIARVHFPASLPPELVECGVHISEYDGREGVQFEAERSFAEFFKAAYLECEATSTVTLADLATTYRQCEQVCVENVFVTQRLQRTDASDEAELESDSVESGSEADSEAEADAEANESE